MRFLIISGLSGAGKSRTMGVLEDMDYYCVDNMPVVFIPKFAEFCLATGGRYERVALVTDIRGREGFDELFKALDEMKEIGCDFKILFVEASVDTIVRRYKESRRPHPLVTGGVDLEEAIRKEKQILSDVRARADYIIDTTEFTIGKLQAYMRSLFVDDGGSVSMNISILSFGFKYGVPVNADLVFDVRFLPNPFYVQELSQMSGLDEPVKKYVLEKAQTIEFLKKLDDMISFLLPLYSEEGKRSLVIAIGCTGGHHRSVAIAEELGSLLWSRDYRAEVRHRDIEK